MSDKVLKKKERGSTDHRVYQNQLKLIKHKVKCVIVGSTRYGLETKSSLSRWYDIKKKTAITCPNSIKKYNENMGGVDKNNSNTYVHRGK